MCFSILYLCISENLLTFVRFLAGLYHCGKAEYFLLRYKLIQMKSSRTLFFALLAVAISVVSCQEPPYINGPGNNDHNPDAIPSAPAPEGVEIPDSAITVAEARAICSQLASGTSTTEKYYVKGWVQNVASGHADAVTSYGNAMFYMSDVSTGSSTRTFYAYQVYGKDGKKLQAAEAVAAGDYVVIYGQLTNYNGTYETVGRGAAHIYSSSNPIFNVKIDTTLITPDPEGVVVPEGTLNVYQANALCETLSSGQSTTDSVYVKGYIRSINSDCATAISGYGNANFIIAPTSDASSVSTFYAYQVYAVGKKKFTDISQVQVGDFVILRGKLTNYNGTYETQGRGASYVWYSSNPNMN